MSKFKGMKHSIRRAWRTNLLFHYILAFIARKLFWSPKIGFWGCFTPFKSLRDYLWNIRVSYFSMLDKSILASTKNALEERAKNVCVFYANSNISGFQYLTRSIKHVNDHVLKTWRSHVSMKRSFNLTGAFHGTFQLVTNLMVDAPPCDINRVALSQIIVSIPRDRRLRRYPVNAWTSKCHLQQSDKCFVYTRRRVATTRVSYHFQTPYIYFYALYANSDPPASFPSLRFFSFHNRDCGSWVGNTWSPRAEPFPKETVWMLFIFFSP